MSCGCRHNSPSPPPAPNAPIPDGVLSRYAFLSPAQLEERKKQEEERRRLYLERHHNK